MSQTESPLFPSQAMIYCDGACSGNPGPGGWAAVAFHPERAVVWEASGHAPQTTNNRMEMTAALESLRWILRQSPALTNVKIHTDSRYVISGLESWLKSWKARGWKKADGEAVSNEDLWRELDAEQNRLTRGQVQWVHVPGHSGVPGNERVDELAVVASKTPGLQLSAETSALVYSHREIFESSGAELIFTKKKTSKSKSSSKKALGYLSVLNGKLLEHRTWGECEARVKGQSGARFKKYTSDDEKREILRDWKLG